MRRDKKPGRAEGGRDPRRRDERTHGRAGPLGGSERPPRGPVSPRDSSRGETGPPKGGAGERVARAYAEAGRGRGAAHGQDKIRDGVGESNEFGRGPREGARAREVRDEAHVFGVQPVLEALRAGRRPIERVTIAEGVHEARLQEIVGLARAAGVPVRRVPRADLQRLVAGANHQGVVASIAAARYRPDAELLDQLAARVGTTDPPLALVLDGVEDPRNLGAIIRTAECAGAHGVFVPERRASGLTETVAKAAAGALEYVPVARAVNLARLVGELKARGVWAVGTAADGETPYTEWDWTQPCALVLGGEGEGLRRLVRESCDTLVRVPLRGRIESLNVSVAAGVVLYEALRQRTAARARAYQTADDHRHEEKES